MVGNAFYINKNLFKNVGVAVLVQKCGRGSFGCMFWQIDKNVQNSYKIRA